MKKGVKIVIVLLILLGVAFLVGRRVLKPKEEVEHTQLPLATGISVEKGDLSITESLVGTIEASEQYALASKVSGEVLEIYAENGAELKKGDKIARLDNQKQIDAAKYTLEQAEAQAKAASDARNRLASLQASGDISAQDFEAADAQAKAAEAQVKAAKLNYDTQVEFATITAPADGVLQNSILVKDAMIPQGTQIASLMGKGKQQLVFSVTEELMKNLSLGQEVKVEKGQEQYTGSITEISGVMNAQTGLFIVKANLENSSLPEGSRVKLTVTKDSRTGVNLLPLSVVYYDNGSPYVYLLEKGEGENGTIKKQSVELGLQGEEKVEILSGLSEKDLVVSSWNNEMYDGAKVRLNSSETEASSDEKTTGETDSSTGAVTSTATETGKEG
ncbi:MAG: efflux RND transporter periplasmic adaptor subunit [Oribacterium sinus]|uniref:Efflux RND transporter periplasmic adaptor subunit n=1 Tax=Oribacterium sinus TaxID=237576 RepID=A0A930DVC6_9FIRM|nr:efflux RND transporter periplasmic adaptor subunit [Oribacterium sinus]